MRNTRSTLEKKLKKIRMLIMDVDGVMTTGGIILGSNREEFKVFDVQDGMGITLARYGELKIGIITGRKSEAVTRRAQELHVDALYQGVKDKITAFTDILKTYDLKENQICYIGDDLLDISVMEEVGVSIAVANACEEVKTIADHVTQKSGGRGAVREVVELILMAQNKWEKVLNKIGLTTG
jgi:3-deoxy-D-manno-octulosonate 8-phosphate phosphatase (KDO 8-P phosphatase)